MIDLMVYEICVIYSKIIITRRLDILKIDLIIMQRTHRIV